MKIVFMGTPDFAVGALRALFEAGHEIVLCVTQPDKPKGRGKEMAFSPVKTEALRLGIPVYQPVKIREPQAIEELKKYPADVFIVAAFGQILTADVLNMPKYGCINIHASLLPKYRGAAPIQWVILNGEKEAGVTIMQMDEGLDTGDMLLSDRIELSADETGDSLHDKLADMGARLIVEALEKLNKGELKAVPQPDGPLFYAKMLKKEMGLLDFTKSAAELERTVRGLYSWPGAYTYCKGKVLKVIKAGSALDGAINNAAPGTVVKVTKEAIYVQCADGLLRIDEVKPEAKKAMSVHDFLLGNKIEAGEVLG
ncbi:MAG: methionyl-tRNA formyltransferase [Lachnospiraceae bacterium]|nr:methionyl-tRNA formyltransferase [Lachnospiraceae bacterium]